MNALYVAVIVMCSAAGPCESTHVVSQNPITIEQCQAALPSMAKITAASRGAQWRVTKSYCQPRSEDTCSPWKGTSCVQAGG